MNKIASFYLGIIILPAAAENNHNVQGRGQQDNRRPRTCQSVLDGCRRTIIASNEAAIEESPSRSDSLVYVQ